MMVMHTIKSGERASIRFKQSMLYRETVVDFRIEVKGQPELFRFTIPFTSLDTIRRVDDGESDRVELLVSLPIPPRFFRKLDEKDTHDEKARYWCEKDAWYRQTDVTQYPEDLKDAPVSLKKPRPTIDLGKLTLYLHVPAVSVRLI